MSPVYGKNRLTAMPTYRRVCKFATLIHILAMTVLYKNNTCIFSILIQLHESEVLAYKSCRNRINKRLTPGKHLLYFQLNTLFCYCGFRNMAQRSFIQLW